ncbi:MAG: hypothetical protein ACRCWO_00010, partial [Bosea sp. (in: a-proteobacteria)]
DWMPPQQHEELPEEEVTTSSDAPALDVSEPEDTPPEPPGEEDPFERLRQSLMLDSNPVHRETQTDAMSGAMAEAPAPLGPVASDEGIVSVRHIGDSTYTMFADGSVTAETPNGPLRFASVADLKAHLTTHGS